jgi:mono/diheme cytochrome c family protein
LALLFLAGLVTSCGNDWRTDMWYQPSLRPQAAPRPEPEHSVRLGAGPYIPDRDEAESLKNPVASTKDSLALGARIFGERCSPCHGAAGHGGGAVSKFFPSAPDLAYAAVKARTDGYIYGTVTFGGRLMPPMGEGLTPEERWSLVNYVRVIQHDDKAKEPHP